MAKTAKLSAANVKINVAVKKRTAIGHSSRSRPLNKSARRSFKPYRGPGGKMLSS